MMHVETAYTPPSLNPLQAALCNALLTRDCQDEMDFFGVRCTLAADPWSGPFAPACGLDVSVRGEPWRVLLSSTGLMGLHPAGKPLVNASHLPAGLRLALFELSLAPVLKGLADFLGLDKPLSIVGEDLREPENVCCALPLCVSLPEEHVAVRVYVPQRTDAEYILLRLATRKNKPRALPAVLVPVALESGHMRLSVAELRRLRTDDILLPEVPPSFDGDMCLRMAPHGLVYCEAKAGQATVRDIVRITEQHHAACSGDSEHAMRKTTMDDFSPAPGANGTDTDAAPAPYAATEQATESLTRTDALLEDLEVTVSFELERRLMSLAELGALVPGYTFALPPSMQGMVTIRVHGKALGTGRLVELGGSLGVQIVSLEQK